jgi:predicted DCC family thiol-disulfide oxidoreductase YuxK
MPPPILLYDGVCGLCNRLVQFILRRDHNAVFRFASLQSALAARILTRHGANPTDLETPDLETTDLDTIYVVVNYELPGESLLSRSNAVLFILHQLGGLSRPAAFSLQLLPKFLRDSAYNAVARHRYRIFGRSETCILPSAQDRSRFLDL